MTDRQFYILLGVGAVAALLIARKGADVAAGIVTGNNALTNGTPYEGFGVLGTLGAATNAASGGKLREWGEALGDWTYDLLNPSSAIQQHYDNQLTGAGYPLGGFFSNAVGPSPGSPQNTWMW